MEGQGLELGRSDSSTNEGENLDKEENGFLVLQPPNDTAFTVAATHVWFPQKPLSIFLCGFCSNFVLISISWFLFYDIYAKICWNEKEITSSLSSSGSSSYSSTSSSVPGSEPIQSPLFLNNTLAYKWLMESFDTQDYFVLQQGFEAQLNQAYCGVASVTTLLNSFRNLDDDDDDNNNNVMILPVDYVYDPYPYATQNNVLDNACVTQNVIYQQEDFDGILAAPFGLGMAQVAALLKCFGRGKDEGWDIQLAPVNPSRVSLEQMRDEVRKILQITNARVLVNFDRGVVHEEGGGHWSPVAKYSSSIDAFLILDVAKYKYPATWIPAQLLYEAMATIDECGIWDFPTAQHNLPENLLYPESSIQYQQAMKQLGCQPTWRGYVSVQAK